MAVDQRVTDYVALLAATAALLHRYSGQGDLLIGTPVAGRHSVQREAIVGPLANTVVVRLSVSPRESARDLIAHTRTVVREAVDHGRTPFDQVVRSINPRRGGSISPLYRVFFALHNWPMPQVALAGLKVELVPIDTLFTECDLTWDLSMASGGIAGQIDYRLDLFSPSTARRIIDHYQNVLRAMCTNPDVAVGDIALMGAQERRETLLLGRGRAIASEFVSLPETMARHAVRTPAAPAVLHSEQVLSFSDLERAANRIAGRLRALGLGTEGLVGVCMKPGAEMAEVLLGIWRAGGAFFIVDPSSPAPRQQRIIAASGTRWVLADRAIAGTPSTVVVVDVSSVLTDFGSRPEPELDISISADQLACVVFSSGSTGEPKGASLTHRSLSVFAAGIADELTLGPADRFLQLAPVGFDVLFEELLPVWVAGGAVAFRDRYEPLEPQKLLDTLDRYRISVLELPNIYWDLLADTVAAGRKLPACLRAVMVGCGPVSVQRARQWWSTTGVRLIHVYGLAEATITSTTMEIARLDSAFGGRSIPIGHPSTEANVYVLDERMRPVPIGVVGEIAIGGAGVARGYWGAPALTAAEIVPDPFSDEVGARMLRTGDVGRWIDPTYLDFLGRKDDQVKIRGTRVEAGEVETVLLEHPKVKQASVAVDGTGEKQLVAAVVPQTGAELSAEALRRFVRSRLPEAFCPQSYRLTEQLPLTPHGKIDRDAILRLPQHQPVGAADGIGPRDPTEAVVAIIFAEVLGKPSILIHDDFFDAGGHSLVALKLLTRLRSRFGVVIGLGEFFERRSVEAVAALIKQRIFEQVAALTENEAAHQLQSIHAANQN